VTDDNPGPGDQHDAKGAHVQVLTAEVRTFVVGSRRVTISVYNQLDEVRYCHIEPFGRVAPQNALDGWVYVVGKDKAAGCTCQVIVALRGLGVTENRKAFENELWRAVPLDGEYSITYAERAAGGHVDALRLLLLAEAGWAYRHQAKVCSVRTQIEQLRQSAKDLRDSFASEFAPLKEVADSWLELPLIVLADLR
jgi:hypothetical protein